MAAAAAKAVRLEQVATARRDTTAAEARRAAMAAEAAAATAAETARQAYVETARKYARFQQAAAYCGGRAREDSHLGRGGGTS